MSPSPVFLIGAGPGRLDFLTLRAHHLLQTADVILYDALIDAAVLSLASDTCEQVYVGKRGGQPSLPQPEIDAMLVDYAQQGKRVVRLKSGDPFVFGRTSSEIQALKAAGLPFEVVPGISSALAAPLFAGIPLTDPAMSRGFAVMSAHDLDALDWTSLATLETLVFLMGARHLETLVERLMGHGRSPDTPIAIIRWAGHPQQHIWDGTLESIVHQVARQPLSPAVIVVGQVVALRPFLQSDVSVSSPPTLPLINQTILVTRAARQSGSFRHMLEAQGATVLELPALDITPPSSWDALDGAIAQLSKFQWLILTSSNGVEAFFERLLTQGKDARSLAGLKIAVVGKKTASSLSSYGLQPDYVPPNFVADSLVAHFPEPLTHQHILFPRVETGGREILVQEFSAAGAMVAEVPAYESGCAKTLPDSIRQALESQHIHVVTFASSKTVRCFHHLLENNGVSPVAVVSNVCLASIGPQTSETCRELLGRVDVEAGEYTLDGLTAALVQWATKSPDPKS